MAKATRSSMGSRIAEQEQLVAHGTRNVFADLGFTDVATRQAKLRLAYELNQVLKHRGLTQTAAARVLGLSQTKVSALKNYSLAGFPVDRLMNLLIAVGQNIQIVIHRKSRSRKG